MTELKPCPFCDNNVELRHYKANGNDWWYIACNHCRIAVDPLMWNADRKKEEIIEIWNRRYLNGMPISLHTITPTPKDEELTLMTKEDERQLHPDWTWGDDDDQSEC